MDDADEPANRKLKRAFAVDRFASERISLAFQRIRIAGNQKPSTQATEQAPPLRNTNTSLQQQVQG